MDQRLDIEELLTELKLDNWRVVESVPQDVVWLQHANRKNLKVPLPWRDLQDLSRETLKSRIFRTVVKSLIH